jgi:hypothetical protein
MKDELIFIKKIFSENLRQYEKHFEFFDKIENYQVKWSYSTIDFYPYETTMRGYKPPKVYDVNPLSEKDDETIFQSRLLNNEVYYSFNYLQKEWGTDFYFTDDKNNKMRLLYHNQNDDDEMILSQLDYKIMDGDKVEKVYCYMYDADEDEESLYILNYFYDGKKIDKIIQSDYFGNIPEKVFDKNNKFKKK